MSMWNMTLQYCKHFVIWHRITFSFLKYRNFNLAKALNTFFSFKFFDGQNVQLEVELFSELEKFSKEIYDPAVKFTEDSAPLKRVFEPSFSDKYTYYVEGREHLLEFGLLVAVLTSDGDQPIWNRAIIG